MSDRRLEDNFWDLRDHAYDHPDQWRGVTAEQIFQRFGEYVEDAQGRGQPIDWWHDVAARLIAWRVDGSEG